MAIGTSGSPRAGEAGHRLDLFISYSLLVGVMTSGVVIGLGLLALLLTGDSGYPPGAFPVRPSEILSGVLALKSFAIIDLGLVLLVFTPVFRVAASAVAFAVERNGLYTAITLVVLSVLLTGLFLGKAEGG